MGTGDRDEHQLERYGDGMTTAEMGCGWGQNLKMLQGQGVHGDNKHGDGWQWGHKCSRAAL